MTYREYVDKLLLGLDRVQDLTEVRNELANAVYLLKDKNLSNEEIRRLFSERIIAITEQQSSLAMRENEQRYKKLINSILQDGNQKK